MLHCVTPPLLYVPHHRKVLRAWDIALSDVLWLFTPTKTRERMVDVFFFFILILRSNENEPRISIALTCYRVFFGLPKSRFLLLRRERERESGKHAILVPSPAFSCSFDRSAAAILMLHRHGCWQALGYRVQGGWACWNVGQIHLHLFKSSGLSAWWALKTDGSQVVSFRGAWTCVLRI